MRTSMMDNKHLRKQLNSFEDHRPYFTYWTCTVQVLILLVALFTYGFGPVGFNLNRRSSLVRNIRSVDFFVSDSTINLFQYLLSGTCDEFVVAASGLLRTVEFLDWSESRK